MYLFRGGLNRSRGKTADRSVTEKGKGEENATARGVGRR